MDSSALTKTSGIITARQGLGQELTIANDPQAVAAAAEAKAMIEASIMQALQFPRDEDMARERIKADCKRPGFAAAALYHKPVGKTTVIGFSVRFAEAANRHWKNSHTVARITQDTPEQCLLLQGVRDLESNITYSDSATIVKAVERREIKAGRRSLGTRVTSTGELVHLIEATADEVRNLIGAEKSKLFRNNFLKLLPADLREEAMGWITDTLGNEHARDPDAARKKVFDRFASLGISPSQLKDYWGRSLDVISAEDLNQLTALFNGLKDREFTWADVMRTREQAAEGEPQGQPRKQSSLKEKVMAQAPKAPEAEVEEKELEKGNK